LSAPPDAAKLKRPGAKWISDAGYGTGYLAGRRFWRTPGRAAKPQGRAAKPWGRNPAMTCEPVRYFVFDTESVADGQLIRRIRYPKEDISDSQAVRRYRDELLKKYDSDFIPYTFQIPVSIAIAKVAADCRLLDLVVLDEPEFRPHVITRHFWLGWQKYQRPTLVTFNGRTFDLPLLELAAFRYGISVPQWFAVHGKNWEQPRNRYNLDAHLDLHDLLVNFGAARFSGGLNLAANLLGKPGKMDVQGHMVQDLFEAGQKAEINDYCRCDVLDTYFTFLRCQVLLGQLSLEREYELVQEAKQWITDQGEMCEAYRNYLAAWGDWHNPWERPAAVAAQH
jgi:predicted PolB exonuclease-like 3'-5' exonuclease